MTQYSMTILESEPESPTSLNRVGDVTTFNIIKT